MSTFKVVPLSLDIRGVNYRRGEIIRFDGIYRDGVLEYRLWPKHFCVVHDVKCFMWFTLKQLEGMQPHWITKQEELPL